MKRAIRLGKVLLELGRTAIDIVKRRAAAAAAPAPAREACPICGGAPHAGFALCPGRPSCG